MESTHWETKMWLARSEKAGRQWVVSADEFGGGTRRGRGGVPLARDGWFSDAYRAQFAWANVMAGGSGFELFSAGVDQELDDFRQLHAAWGEFSRVRRMFSKHRIPFWAMNNDNALVSMRNNRGRHRWMYCLAARGEAYVVYSGRDVITPVIDLRGYQRRSLRGALVLAPPLGDIELAVRFQAFHLWWSEAHLQVYRREILFLARSHSDVKKLLHKWKYTARVFDFVDPARRLFLVCCISHMLLCGIGCTLFFIACCKTLFRRVTSKVYRNSTHRCETVRFDFRSMRR
eukprot:IDg15558t1